MTGIDRLKDNESMPESELAELDQLARLPPEDRAAALMHFIYTQTINKPDVDWTSQLPAQWKDLDDRARKFNLAILQTWREHPQLLEDWITQLCKIQRPEIREAACKVG